VTVKRAPRARPSAPRKKAPAPRRRRTAKHVLRLYVTGVTGKSVRAIQNVRRICDEHLKGRYELEVIDLYKNLPLARGDQIIAAPTLIKRLPLPLRRLIGDMSDEARVLVGLDVRPAGARGDR
jgi:circadian clock protein KaiB